MDEQFIGQIEVFPYGFAPMGWLQCSGQTLQIAQNTALYSLIGVNFGGDGRTNFMLPNLQNAAPIANTAYYIATEGIYPTRP